MKLYYAPGACSLAAHIAAREAGIAVELEKVDLGTKRTAAGADYKALNPKGYVPAVELDDGSLLTEVAAVLQYVADRNPGAGLMPPPGTTERYRLIEWLTFISSEIHKGFGPLWSPKAPEEAKRQAKERLVERLAFVERALAGGPYLSGERFTAPDAYLFTVVNWSRMVGLDLAPFPNLQEFQKRVAARPKVQEALKAEGLAR